MTIIRRKMVKRIIKIILIKVKIIRVITSLQIAI